MQILKEAPPCVAEAPAIARCEPRVSCATDILVLPHARHSDEEPQQRRVELVNYSASGLSIISDQPMAVGEQFAITLESDAGDHRKLIVLYSVRYCHVTADGRYKVGAQRCGDVVGSYRVDSLFASLVARRP